MPALRLLACATDEAEGDTSAEASGAWATGGTAAMSGSYPDPFTEALSTCTMTCQMTEGPCYADTPERKDISEGIDGLPMRLSFKVVDDQCNAVSGATVEVWHCAPSGLYSGAEAAEMCTDNNAEAVSSSWFRGYQETDSAGRVDFNSCMPGWYSGRAVHVHFRVIVGGSAYLVAQLFLPQSLLQDVFTTHPVYQGYGVPDTANADDKVLGDNDPTPYTATVAQMDDGTLQAALVLVVKSAAADEVCTAPEADSGGGPP